VTIENAGCIGFTADQLAHLVRVGQLESSNRGVYRVPSYPSDWMSKLQRQCIGAKGYVSHLSAAMLFQLGAPNDLTPGFGEVTVPKPTRKRLDEIKLYRASDFGEISSVEIDGLICTSIDRTLCDIAAIHRFGVFQGCYNMAVRRRLITLRRFAAAAQGDRRRRGRSRLREALQSVGGDIVPPSDWSQWAVERLVDAGFPEPQKEVDLYDVHGLWVGRVDLYWPEFNLVVELDGREFHFDTASFESDRSRDARLLGVGIAVLRFTWSQFNDGDYFERSVQGAISHRQRNEGSVVSAQPIEPRDIGPRSGYRNLRRQKL
jgi:hypothetical protein